MTIYNAKDPNMTEEYEDEDEEIKLFREECKQERTPQQGEEE
jgi:hypothetical protein